MSALLRLVPWTSLEKVTHNGTEALRPLIDWAQVYDDEATGSWTDDFATAKKSTWSLILNMNARYRGPLR